MTYRLADVGEYYASLFAARRDVYSAWTPEGWRPVREPLTGELVVAALLKVLKGTPSISGYMIAPGSVSHVAAIDFDTDNGFEQALQLSRFMELEGLPSYIETSRRGAHLWCVLDKVLPAVAIRAAMRGLLQGAELPDDDPHIEIRPGSDTLTEGGLGHALRLPLMPHPKTGRQGKLLYASGEPMMQDTFAKKLLAIEWAPHQKILAWAELWRRPPVTVLPPDHRNPREYGEDTSSASELLRTLWGVPDVVPGRVFSCPASAYHSHNDVHKGCRVFPDDRRVICHKPGCILNNDGRGRGTYELRKLAPLTS
jgi:hypothetical protein